MSEGSKLPLSAVMVIYNEADILKRSLESVADLVDELLVVHDGPCSDASLDIASGYGARVIVRPHEGIAEPHRAWLYSQCRNTWILQLDADEFLSSELREALPSLIRDPSIACYETVWPNWDGTKYTTQGWPHKKVLFRKDKIEFLAFPQSEVQALGPVQKVSYVLEHRPNYDNLSWNSFQKKWRRWVKVHARYLLKDPNTYDRYPANARIVVPRYYKVISHPYVLAFPLAFYQAFQSFASGGYKAGLRGLKISLFIGLYYFYLALEVAHLESVGDLL